jgi:alpha-tubulin suppressor-like RCC1 family protein
VLSFTAAHEKRNKATWRFEDPVGPVHLFDEVSLMQVPILRAVKRRCMSYQAFGFGEAWIGALGMDAALEEMSTAVPSPPQKGRGRNAAEGQINTPIPYALPKVDITGEVMDADCGWGHSALLTSQGALVLLGRAHDFKNTLKHINTRRGPLSGLQSIMQRLSNTLFSEDMKPMVHYCPEHPGDSFSAVSCSVGAMTAAITKKGRLYITGQNFYGQCGIGKSDPEILYAPEFPVVGLGEEQNGDRRGGNGQTTNDDDDDNLGGAFASSRSSSSSSSSSNTTAVDSTDPVVQVACGFEHVLALTKSGQLFSWGRGDRGQLGLGLHDKDSYMAPARLLGTERDPHRFLDKKVTRIEANMSHSACVDEDGQLFIWGKMQSTNPKEKRIDGDVMDDQRMPREVFIMPSEDQQSPPKVTAITAGQAHFSFLTDDGRIHMIGMRGRGRTFDDAHLRLATLRKELEELKQWAAGRSESAVTALEGQHHGVGSASLLVERAERLLNDYSYYSEENINSLLASSEGPIESLARSGVCGPIDAAIPEVFTQLEPLEIKPLGPLAASKNNRKIVALKSDTHFSYALTDDGMLWRFGWRGIVLPVLSFLHLHVADVSFGLHHGVVLAKKNADVGVGAHAISAALSPSSSSLDYDEGKKASRHQQQLG